MLFWGRGGLGLDEGGQGKAGRTEDELLEGREDVYAKRHFHLEDL